MRRIIAVFIFFMLLLPSVKAQKTITITNPTSAQRSELVSIPVGPLGIEVGKGVIEFRNGPTMVNCWSMSMCVLMAKPS